MSEAQHAADSTAEKRLHQQICHVRSWLYGQALPTWADLGVDGDFGFVEALAFDGSSLDLPYKRVFVQARQLYVFSHAYLTGYTDGLEVARRGWNFMRRHAWRADGGWVRRVDRRGVVLDPTLYLYAQAAALLGIAWWMRASGETAALEFADRTLAVVDERLTSWSRRGWLSERGPDAALLQNPHMHLFEALLALYEVTGDRRFVLRAEDILSLFREAFFDPRTGTLAEYYDGAWERASGERGRIVEPGHHYEWVWLLQQAAPTMAVPGSYADALFQFAETHGTRHGGRLVVDELLEDGTCRSPSYRLWPVTEGLKAQLARFESSGAVDARRLSDLLAGLSTHFLAAPRAGLWIDRIGTDLKPTVDRVPASSFYHVFVAVSELLRLESRLRTSWDVA